MQECLYENSDEPYAEEIAEAIFARNRTNGNPVKTTTDLRNVIEEVIIMSVPKNNEIKGYQLRKACAESFSGFKNRC